MVTRDQVEAAADLVVREAALLDAGRFDEWLALFSDDCRYWIPLLGARQSDPYSHNSIAFEDRLLLQLRIDRLKDPRAHSQHPRSQCQHVLQRPVIDPADDSIGSDDSSSADASLAVLALRTPFIYLEARGESQVLLAGTCRHELVQSASGWVILQKRVDLLNADRPLPAIQLFI